MSQGEMILETTVETKSKGADKAQADLQKTLDAASKTQANFDKVSAAFDRTMDRIKRTAAAFAAVTLGREALGGLAKIVEEGVRFNSMMEDSKLSVATMLSTAYEYTDKATGQQATGVEKMNAAMQHAGEIQVKLQKKNLETAATYEQLNRVFAEALPYAIQTGMKVGEDELVEFSATIAKVAKTAMVPLDQLGEEVRSILSGNMRTRNTRLSGIIVSGLGVADLEQANLKLRKLGQSGEFYGKMMAALKPFLDSVAISQGNLTTIFSNFKDVMSMVLGESMLSTFYGLKKALIEVSNYIAPINKETGKIELNKDVVQGFQKIGDALGGIITGTLAVVKFTAAIHSALGPFADLISLGLKLGAIALSISLLNKGIDLLGHGLKRAGEMIKTNLTDKITGAFNRVGATSAGATIAKQFSEGFKANISGIFDGSKKLYQNPFGSSTAHTPFKMDDSFFNTSAKSSGLYNSAVTSTTMAFNNWSKIADTFPAKLDKINANTVAWANNVKGNLTSGWKNVSLYISKSWEDSFKLQKAAPAQTPGNYSAASNILAAPLKFAMFSGYRAEVMDGIKSKIVSITNVTDAVSSASSKAATTINSGWTSVKTNLNQGLTTGLSNAKYGLTSLGSNFADIGRGLKALVPTWGELGSLIPRAVTGMANFVSFGMKAATAGLNAYLAWKMLENIDMPFSDKTFGEGLTSMRLSVEQFVGYSQDEMGEYYRELSKQDQQFVEDSVALRKKQTEKVKEAITEQAKYDRQIRQNTARGIFSTHEMDESLKFTKDLDGSFEKVNKEIRQLDTAIVVANFDAVGDSVGSALAQSAAKLNESLQTPVMVAFWDSVMIATSNVNDLEEAMVRAGHTMNDGSESAKAYTEALKKMVEMRDLYFKLEIAHQNATKAQDAAKIHQEEIKRRGDLYKQYESYFQLMGDGTAVVAAQAAAEEYSTKVKIEGLNAGVKGYKEYVAAIKAASAEKVRQLPIEQEFKQESALYNAQIAEARAFYDEKLAVELEYKMKSSEIKKKLDTHQYESKNGQLTERGLSIYGSEQAVADKKRLDDLRSKNFEIQSEMASLDISIAQDTNEKMLAIQLEYFQKLAAIENDYQNGKFGKTGSDEAIMGYNKAVTAARVSGDKAGTEYMNSFRTSMAEYQMNFADQSGDRTAMLKADKAVLQAKMEAELSNASITEERKLRIKEYYAEEIRRVDANLNNDTFGGIEDGMKRLKAEQTTWYESMSNMTYNVAHGIGDAFGNLFDGISTKGKNAFQDLGKYATDMLKSILSAMNKALGNQIASQIFSGIGIGDFFKSKSALGNVFSGGNVQAFALGGAFGTVLTQPTVFPMANGGTGLAGEAGPEAVIPLSRGRNGRMGVDATGMFGGGLSNLAIRVEIKNKTNQSLSASQEGQPRMDMGEIVIPLVIDAYLNNKHGLQTVINQGKKT